MRIELSDHFTLKKLLKFVFPSIAMMVFTNIYSVVDGLFVSNFEGKDAVAAINLIFPLIIVLGAIGFMLGAGGSALVSKTLGEGDKERANKYFSMLVYVTTAIGITIAVAGQFCVPYIAKLFGAKGVIYDYCVLYGRVLLAAQPFFILQNIFQSFFVTAEKPRLGFIVTLIAGVTNMACDALFIAGFGWGLAGAAFATALSEVIGGVVPLVYFACKNDSLLRLTKTKFYGKALLKSFTNGSSEFFANVSSAIVMMLYNYQIQRYALQEGIDPNDGLAAYGAMGYVMMIFFAIFMGYAVGSAPLFGYNYGAQNKNELKNLFKKSVIIMLVAGCVMTLLCQILAYPAIKLFGFDGALCDLSVRGMRMFSPYFTIAGISIFASSMFTALNNGLVSGIIAFVRMFVFQTAAVLVVPLIFGLDGVWSAMNFSEIFSLILSVSFLIGCRKKYEYV